jgi:hypothetical protein
MAFAALPTFARGEYVWVRWGNTRGVQLGCVLDGNPVQMTGETWYRVQVFSKKYGRWNDTGTERRILRALTGAEIRQYKAAGVIPEKTT